jgi:OOP family OmpA-OmpF porin
MSWRTSSIVAALVLAAAPAWAQQGVTVLDKPPSVEDLKKALAVPEAQTPAQAPGSSTGSAANPASTDEGGAPAAKHRNLRQIILKGPVSVEEVPMDAGGAAAAVALPAAPPVGATLASPAPGVPTTAVTAGSAGGAAAAPTVGIVAPTAVAPSLPSTQPALGRAVALPIQFEFGSAVVSANSQLFIQVVGQLLQQNPDLYLLIEGHTDAVGSAQSNMMLSWERAFAVFRTLVDQYGIDPARLQPVGKGATEPLPNVSPYDGQNRRVQFRTMG